MNRLSRWLIGLPAAALTALSGSALAEWGLNLTQGVTPTSKDVFGLHMEMPDYEYILDLRHEALHGPVAPAPLSESQQDRPISALLERDFLATEPRTS